MASAIVSASGRPSCADASWMANRSKSRKSACVRMASRSLPRRRPRRMFHVQILTRLSSLCMQTKVRSLDDLAALGPDALMALYASARTPALEELDGRLTGRTVPRAQQPHVPAWLEMNDGEHLGCFF